jgi:hypothetical protein
MAMLARPFCLWLPRSHAFTPHTRATRVTILLIATFLMGLADLALTLEFVTSSGMVEANPIARYVMAHNSTGIVILWKLATMFLGLGILFWARRSKGAELGTWLCFLVMAALSFHWLTYTGAVVMEPDYAQVAEADDPRFISITP